MVFNLKITVEVLLAVKINRFVLNVDKNVSNLALSVGIINYILLKQHVTLRKNNLGLLDN